jgi:hypothetical protein
MLSEKRQTQRKGGKGCPVQQMVLSEESASLQLPFRDSVVRLPSSSRCCSVQAVLGPFLVPLPPQLPAPLVPDAVLCRLLVSVAVVQ